MPRAMTAAPENGQTFCTAYTRPSASAEDRDLLVADEGGHPELGGEVVDRADVEGRRAVGDSGHERTSRVVGAMRTGPDAVPPSRSAAVAGRRWPRSVT